MDTPIHASTACSACGLPESAWKERPILFSGPMVRAILSGRKTQTRRVVKDRYIDAAPPVAFFKYLREKSPYGQPGDRLWVRERCELTTDDCEPGAMSVRYLADGEVKDIGTGMPDSCPGLVDWINGRWSRPSIHMPRWASRILLEITAVRVERLNDISEADCIAEGCSGGHGVIPDYGYHATPFEHYHWIWESINGAGSWAQNPWVWVVEFKDVSRG